ncbi:uncharacterized protein K02A2.6-like [Ostrinia furnacalis]|uniref:uncharacterized protein K02A2.6-like n=1 Tax=Ostrinia furnacalis TaxID=93504 RepID=UPI00103F9602|nr:uncharacterized protein K02A2.6-like [Ostrinia furnacalis]
MAYIGNISVFDYKSQDWQIFYSRLVQFIELNDINETKQRAVLLTHLSDESYRLTKNLFHPQKLEETSFKDLVKKLNDHFTPKRSTFADRAKFYEATRSEMESAEEWGARLRGLAVHCEFGTELDVVLRDRFVLGLNAGPERDRLFEQDSSTLTFAKALEIAQQAACARAARAASGGLHGVVKQEPVYRVSENHRSTKATQQETSHEKSDHVYCSVCGLKNHVSSKCRFKGYRCNNCGQKGHLRKVCRAEKSEKLRLNNIESDCKECEVFNLRYVNYEPIKLDILVNNLKLCMELDSGSGTSVISEKLYLKYFPQVKLHKSDLTMCLYNSHKITPLGYFIAQVSFKNKINDLKFYIVKNGGPPLLGRDFMALFNIGFTTCNHYTYKNDGGAENDVQQLLNQFPGLWKDALGCFNKFKVELHVKENSVPKFFKPRSIPFALKDKVDEELTRLVKLGVLVPVRFSEYATPIVPVLKENGKVKIAGDYSCTLNKDLKIDKYPLPRIEEVFAKIGGGQHYSKIDLSNAYNQFLLSDSSQELTTINTPKGLFKYTRLVYGLANAPAIFQRAMETLLSGIDGVSCWLDDVCCTGPDRKTHMSRLKEVLERLHEAGLRLQKEKCAFFQDSVTYLGYVIDKSGLKTCPSKVEAIIKSPAPTNVLGIKRFLGVVNYYRNFIPNASSVLEPLHELLRSGVAWEWGPRQAAAFERVKRELGSARVLAHFEPRAPLTLAVDAGPAGLGAVLAHQLPDGTERPIAFASRSLGASEKNYSQIQKEATAIIFGVKHFHQYLYGRQDPFILKTDHRPLLSIFGNKNGISVTSASRLQRYALILSAYNYTVKYISSENNLIADYFSRAPLPIPNNVEQEEEGVNGYCYLKFLDANVKPVSFVDIREAIHNDKIVQTVFRYMRHGWPRKITCKNILPYFQCKSDLEEIDGCLFRGHRVVIPTVFRKRMLEELHSAHFGVVKTKSTARSRMWWPGIDGDIEQWVGACARCAAVRSDPPRAPPAAWPRAAGPWRRLHIDYMSVGRNVYLIVIDAFSKWLECIHMNNCGTSSSALIRNLKYLFSRYGIPHLIVSDNDPKICSTEFQAFCSNNGIKYLTSPIYHPCSNGQAENSVKTCKKMLKCILDNNNLTQLAVQEKLWGFLFDYRNTVHCSTGFTPAKLMMGRDLKSRLDLIFSENNYERSELQNNDLPNNRCFNIGDTVWAKWYVARKSKWSPGTITKVLGNRMFEIKFKQYNVTHKRHLDQIMKFKGNNIVEPDNNYEEQNDYHFDQQSSPSTHDEMTSSGPAADEPPAVASPGGPAAASAPGGAPVAPAAPAQTFATVVGEGGECEDDDEFVEAQDIDTFNDADCNELERPIPSASSNSSNSVPQTHNAPNSDENIEVDRPLEQRSRRPRKIQQQYKYYIQPYVYYSQQYPYYPQQYPYYQQSYPNYQQTYPKYQQSYPNYQQAYPNYQQAYPNYQQAYPNYHHYPNEQQLNEYYRKLLQQNQIHQQQSSNGQQNQISTTTEIPTTSEINH